MLFYARIVCFRVFIQRVSLGRHNYVSAFNLTYTVNQCNLSITYVKPVIVKVVKFKKNKNSSA